MAKLTRRKNQKRKSAQKHRDDNRDDNNVTSKQKITNNKGENEETPNKLQNKTLCK